MPPPFRQIDRETFAVLLEQFRFTREITGVHMHHTWRPNQSQYDRNDGHRTIVAMYDFHTRKNGWSDIAQHITIAPDGSIWLGRDWNASPASAKGHNGTAQAGPFMFEIIGDFDAGRDTLQGEQRRTVVEVIARLQKRFRLSPQSLRFHSMMSEKSCPGTGVDYDEILAEVAAIELPAVGAGAAPRGDRPAPFATDEAELFDNVREALRSMEGAKSRAVDSPDAEPTYDDTSFSLTPEPLKPASARATDALSADDLARLRPHLVNLTQGRFSSGGEVKTQKGDVDAIFDQHLVQALADAKTQGRPLRILFFAHGGLVKESAGLAIALKHLDFWKKNGIYPVNFVWETGLFETIGALLRRSQAGARGFISDRLTDPLVEATVRALQGPTVWGGMKRSAELSITQDGGARYVAEKLKAFCDSNAGDVELHAVGHSAGSIFHAHFLSFARSVGVKSFRSTHFLAPAARTDLFKSLLAPLVGDGKGIDRLTLYTMSRDFERDDNCARIYRKSLLYLIFNALEPEKDSPILGLEQSLRADPALVTLFGLNSTQTRDAQVVLSVTSVTTGRSATRSRTHGGFDDDAPTLGSVVRRVLGKQDADTIAEYVPAGARGLNVWDDQVDWPEDLVLATPPAPATAFQQTTIAPQRPLTSQVPAAASWGHKAPARIGSSGAGRRRALCIGIDTYPTAPLAGCVADAHAWASTLERLGFETAMLPNGQATRAAILRNWQELIEASAPGDVIVVQYAGHGTHLDDLNGDEPDGQDEALCPVDFDQGAFLIDDDIRALFASIPDGVNFTTIFDCCHSGTVTRVAAALLPARSSARDRRARFMRATPAMQDAHRRFRATSGGPAELPPGDVALMRNVSFAACQDDEVAWESDGHGDFTVRATRVLSSPLAGLTNEQFQQRVLAEFGPGARQSPRLDSAPHALALGFLQPILALRAD